MYNLVNLFRFIFTVDKYLKDMVLMALSSKYIDVTKKVKNTCKIEHMQP